MRSAGRSNTRSNNKDAVVATTAAAAVKSNSKNKNAEQQSANKSQTRGNRANSRKSVGPARKVPVESEDENEVMNVVPVSKMSTRVKKAQIVSPQSTAKKGSQSQLNNLADETLYGKGTYVAFIDASDSLEKFKIAQLLEDLREIDDEVEVDIYEETGSLSFTRSAKKIPIFEYSIVCDVQVQEQMQSAPKKRGAAQPEPMIKINRQQFNKVNRQMENAVRRIEEEKNSEQDSISEDDDDKQSSSDDENEEDEDEEPSEGLMKKVGKKALQARRMVKTANSQKVVSTSFVGGLKSAKKGVNVKDIKAASKKITKGGKKASAAAEAVSEGSEGEESKGGDQEMTHTEINNEESEEASIEQINTQSKGRRASKKQQKKRAPSMPKVGTKRLRTAPKKNLDEEEDEEDEEGGMAESKSAPIDDEDDEEASSQPVKKRKVGAGKAKSEKKPKAKKVPKKPTEFKKGKWNPHVDLVDLDKYKDHEQDNLFSECCIRCNNRNIIRAAVTGNQNLLKAGIAAKTKISQMTAYWSPEVKHTSLDYILKENKHELLEIMLHPKLHVPQHSTYQQELNNFYNERVHNPQYLMNFIESGMVSHMAYGARVRKVEMTRGNRQGNNAFLQYEDNYQRNPHQQITDESFIRRILYSDTIDYETLKQVFKLNPGIENYLQSYVYEAVRGGNRKIAHEIIKAMVQYPNFGFNQLHADVLSDNALPEKVLRQSVTKKANTNKDLTPLHCACINPNPKYLKALLDTGAELQTIDQDLRRPVHYAAACIGHEPIEVLIAAGANLADQDNQKRNCLHYAAITGRAQNIRVILTASPNLVNLRDKKSMTPICYAAKYGQTEAVKVLLEFKAKLNVGAGAPRMTPLIWASTYGHLDLVEFLLDNKARVLGKDKFKRTALTMAVRNGHCKIASILLQRGSEWDHNDSSMNTPLHYAAAYGWLDCIELLLKTGADVNAQNSWKISPINIAMLKNHHGCVKRFLEEEKVDVNGKDDKGRSLIMLALYVLDDESYDFISYLLKKGANPNQVDLDGQSSLHYIAKYQPKSTDEMGKTSRIIHKRQVEVQKKIAQLLIQNEADLSLKDKQNKTPFSLCLDLDNAPLLEFLKDKVSINKTPDLFFAFKDKIFNVEYQQILESLIKNDPPTKETMNCLDSLGQTPFLAYIKAFTQKHDQLVVTITNKINQQSFIHGANHRMYQLTNADVFDKFADQTNYYNYNPQFTNEEKTQMVYKFLDGIIIKPFVNLLKFLISQGADVHAQVQKLKRYRDLEELKRLHLQQLAQGEVSVLDLQAKEKEEKVLRREEKLQEMNQRKKMPYGRGKHRYNLRNQNAYLNNPVIPANDGDNGNDNYDKINGEKVLREYGPEGLRNAIHIIISHPQKTLFEFLLSLEINPDQPDYDEVTPFNLMSTSQVNTLDENTHNMIESFLKHDVRVDFPNRKGRTPFLNFYEKQNFPLANRMLDLGANVNQMDVSGLFALKYALIRRQNDSIQTLLDRGANINQIDNKGRNLLHHAINMSSATADATFETEQFLIDRGVDINLRDQKNRTPLHYAFVKIQDWRSSSQIDPIETVSSLCGCKGLDIDVADKWQKTPLHYASQRGASICAMYLVQRGAKLENKDIYGNTPLGVGLMYQHYNYGIILIQKGALVHPLSYKEDSERIKKMWEDEEKAKKALQKTQLKKDGKQIMSQAANGDQEMKSDNDSENEEGQEKFVKHTAKKHQNLFNNGINNGMNIGINYYNEADDDEEDYSDEDEDDQHQENIFNQQNAFGMQVYNTAAQRRANNAMQFGAFGGNQFGFGMPTMPATKASAVAQPAGSSLITQNDKEGVSMFKLSIRGGQQGLAYLMLDNGYDYMLAMQDAMDEKKFMLVLTLLSKTPDDNVVQSKNSKGQNLFHILSMNAGSCALEHLQRIYNTLSKRGVDCRAKDNFGRTALHYSVISGSLQLVQMLVSQTGGYDPNEVDNTGHTPLSLYLEGNKNTPHQFYHPAFKHENIFLHLVKAGADVNFVYPEKLFKPALKEEELDEEHLVYYDVKGQYYCSPLINLIRQNPQNEVMRNNLIGLLEFGAKLDVVDSDGRDPIMHAIIKDNAMALRLMLENKKALKLNTNAQDQAGKSACHYVINPVRFGSYENVEILQLLHQFGFDLQLKDSQGCTPAHYAQQQESGVMLRELARLTGQENRLQMIQRQISMIQSSNWPEPKVDYEVDAEQYMELANEREKQLAKEKDERVPVDKTGSFEISYQVYYDEQEKPWDVYLTKVDLKNGIYGDYVFYKMQLLYDTNRDLYVVFTRWGRIGETGMNQRTPFTRLEDAKEDYSKIFKQKTGGNNFEELDKFSRVKKKYNLTRVNYVTVNMKDYLQPFDYEKSPKSRLPQSIYDLFQEISNVTMYQRAITQYGIDTNVLPFSGVNKQTLVEARQMLIDIQELIKEDIEISKEGIRADFDKLTQVKEKISELSSRYYELIPLERFKNQIAPPLNNQHHIKTQYDLLETLTNIEYASKVLLGALLRQKEMNPIDYIYQAMNLMIDPLDNESPEYEVIRTYIDNTRNVDNQGYNPDQFEIANIFKVQRKGEAEMINTFKEVPNHYLLYHGSMMFNFIGLLSQGLKIAPPEAPATGYMFGKGVYFADMFDKSFAYAARGYNQQESYLMLMCEVVLGKSKELNQAEYVEKLEHPYHSVKGCGRRGPAYKHTITLPNGVKIPYGPVINYHEGNVEKQRQLALQHNEYIVYNTSQVRMRYVVQIKKKDPSKK